MKHVRTVLMAVALSTIVVSPVKGAWDWQYLYTGGSNFATTASVKLDATKFAPLGLPTYFEVSIEVTNMGYMGVDVKGEVYMSIGLVNLPKDVLMTVTSASPSTWSPPASDLGGDGLLPYTWGLTAPPSPSKTGLIFGQTATFTFRIQNSTLTDVLAAYDGSEFGIGIHAISGPNGCSTKWGGSSTGGIDNANSTNYAVCTPTVVPEPSTVVLLATGLMGLGGLAWFRRREEED